MHPNNTYTNETATNPIQNHVPTLYWKSVSGDEVLLPAGPAVLDSLKEPVEVGFAPPVEERAPAVLLRTVGGAGGRVGGTKPPTHVSFVFTRYSYTQFGSALTENAPVTFDGAEGAVCGTANSKHSSSVRCSHHRQMMICYKPDRNQRKCVQFVAHHPDRNRRLAESFSAHNRAVQHLL